MPNSFRLGSEKVILVFLGKQGTGKGTYAQMLEKDFGIKQVSIGDLLREEIAKGTALGKQIEEIVSAGNLVPDELTVEILDANLERFEASKGLVFDGFPRTLEQCNMLDEILEKRNLKVDLVMHFVADEKILVKRLTTRWTCSKCKKIYNTLTNPPKKAGVCDLDRAKLFQREDDKEEAIKKRFGLYEQEIKPILECYKGKVIEVEASEPPIPIYKKVLKILKK